MVSRESPTAMWRAASHAHFVGQLPSCGALDHVFALAVTIYRGLINRYDATFMGGSF